MNYRKTNPRGIDKAIDKIQTRLYNNLGFDKIDGYGRIYPILKDDSKPIPMYYISGTDYRDVLFNDKSNSNGNFFFYEEPTTKRINSFELESNIQIIFQLNITELYTNGSLLNDEEARLTIEDVLTYSDFKLNEIVRGLRSLEDFNHNLRDRKLCFFNFKGTIRYQFNC